MLVDQKKNKNLLSPIPKDTTHSQNPITPTKMVESKWWDNMTNYTS